VSAPAACVCLWPEHGPRVWCDYCLTTCPVEGCARERLRRVVVAAHR
jgi:hypothetical protein